MTKARDLSVVPNQSLAFKNRIINGDMRIDQRNAGASVTPANNQYTVDRFIAYSTQSSKFTVQQNAGSVTPPAGFRNYLGITSTSAYSVGAGDYFGVAQYIEGFNTADLNFGTANAQTVTLSFWVRSSLTGTFASSIANSDFNRSYPYTYTINSANTWEYKTITIPGDTTGTWVGATNGLGLRVYFNIGAGSTYAGTAGAWAGSGLLTTSGATSVVGTNGATFYITGVQLEVGSNATSFDYRPYGTELALCQRYYWQTQATAPSWNYIGVGLCWTSTLAFVYVQYPVQMRSAPTVGTFGTINTTNVQVVYGGSTQGASAVAGVGSIETTSLSTRIDFTTTSGLVSGHAALPRFVPNTGVTFSSEL